MRLVGGGGWPLVERTVGPVRVAMRDAVDHEPLELALITDDGAVEQLAAASLAAAEAVGASQFWALTGQTIHRFIDLVPSGASFNEAVQRRGTDRLLRTESVTEGLSDDRPELSPSWICDVGVGGRHRRMQAGQVHTKARATPGVVRCWSERA